MARYILVFDPSGDWDKGTTGVCLFDSVRNMVLRLYTIAAKDYQSMHEYWDAHIKTIFDTMDWVRGKQSLPQQDLVVVVEEYRLYADKAKAQINSRFFTSQLIGLITQECWRHSLTYETQPAAAVMRRWNDSVLNAKGYIIKLKTKCVNSKGKTISRHERDALRHALHYSLRMRKGTA
jgi:hypothetical protein